MRDVIALPGGERDTVALDDRGAGGAAGTAGSDFEAEIYRCGPAGQNAANGLASGLSAHIVMSAAERDALCLAAHAHVAAVWDQVLALVAEAGPMPLMADEPWVEGDAEYKGKLAEACGTVPDNLGVWFHGDRKAVDLDLIGCAVGRPRARLARGPDRIADLDRVEILTEAVTDEGFVMSAGSTGTVVAVYGGGTSYEVEFAEGLATVEAGCVRLVAGAE